MTHPEPGRGVAELIRPAVDVQATTAPRATHVDNAGVLAVVDADDVGDRDRDPSRIAV
jgi:hypothetical protein